MLTQRKLSADDASGMRRILPHVLPRLARNRITICGAMASLIGGILMRLLEPWPLKIVIDHVIGHKHAGPMLDGLGPITLLVMCAVMIVALTGIRALMEYLSSVGFALVGSRVLTELRADLYRHLQRLSMTFHDRSRAGDLTLRVVSDIGVMRDVAVTALLPLFASLLILVGMATVTVILNWRLALVAAVPLPLLALSTVRLSRKLRSVSRKQRTYEGQMAATVAETMSGMRLVQALGLEAKMSAYFTGKDDGSKIEEVQSKKVAASLERSTDVIVGVSTALVITYGALLVLRGSLSAGELLVFLAYLQNAFRPARDFAKYSGRISKAVAAGERIVDLLEEVPEIRDLPGAVPAPALTGAIRLENISFSYSGGSPVLRGINLDITPNRMIALVGSSGAGKSTIASLLMRLYEPTGGRILVDGHDIRNFTLESVRGQISVVLQDTLLLSASVSENIGLADPDARQDAIEAAARLAGADEFIRALPRGYDTVLSERGVSLSNGQRQRLAIARAALRSSPILILDEPTTGLDRANERLIIAALRRLAAQRTVLLVTHDLAFAAHADSIAFLENGSIVERGSHSDMMAADNAYAAMFRARVSAIDGETYATAS